MNPELLAASLVLSFALAGLGAIAYRRSVRDREPAWAIFGAAVALFGMLAAIEPLRHAPISEALVNAIGATAFAGSGFLLLLSRHEILPLSRAARVGAGVASGFAAAATILLRVPYGPGARPSATQWGALVMLTGVWSACVIEPVARFWRVARGKPVLQRARLRAMSAGYGCLVLILLLAQAANPSGKHPAWTVAALVAGVVPVGILYASYAPPRWLLRLWRAREEQSLLRDAPLFAQDPAQLARRAMEWALRLTGADAGVVAGPQGSVTASRGLTDEQAERLAEELRPVGEGGLDVLGGERPRPVISVPVPTENGSGCIIVIGGALTPRFAQDELRLIRHYASALALALDHTQLSEMKDVFLTAVSHELRTPLSIVLLAVRTMQEKDDRLSEPQRRDMLGRLERNAERLNSMLSDLLDIDRLSRGILVPRRQLTDIDALVGSVLERTEALKAREVVVDMRSAVVNVDPAYVERIIENLLANAAKHTPSGAAIWVRTRSELDGVLVTVDDAGAGVPAELREAIFQPFLRGPSAPAHSPGTGVGLALVARFAELHGGRAWVQDRPGGGSSFRVWLPGARSERGDRLGPSLRQSLTSRGRRDA